MAVSTKNRYKLMINPSTPYSRHSCSAYGCDMRAGTNALSEIKMYRFPRNPYRRRRWELATRRANFKAHNRSGICSKHFISGKPSKDPKHPDYVPSIFVFTENVQKLKKSFNKLQKKNSLIAESHQNSTDDGNTATNDETYIATSCGKGFCVKCFSPESVSSVFKDSLTPLNQTLSQLMEKFKHMEEERDQLRNELAICREEIYKLREAHQHCKKQSQSTSRHSKPKSPPSVDSSSTEDANEILESMYSEEQDDDVFDPDFFPSLNLEKNYHWSFDKQIKSKRKKKIKGSDIKLSDANVCLNNQKSDSGSPITIVYLKQ